MKQLRFLFVEPFFGGSHRDFAEGLVAHSRHRIDLVTLPARFWKWRMRGAALYFTRKIANLDDYDGLITTDLMSLSDFKALNRGVCPPALVYFHENQLTYPLAPGEQMDFQFGFTDITTALAADRILFNSDFHFDAFFETLPGFIAMMPEYRPGWVVEDIRAKSRIEYPGCRFSAELAPPQIRENGPPLIIWNHRWEFDKNPDEFFKVLGNIARDGFDFRVALMGENFQAMPKAFIRAKETLGTKIVQYGYVEKRKEYIRWLERGDIVVSTAIQENFGISVIEAVRNGCLPLLPGRLSYPEILPSEFHGDYIYADEKELEANLLRMLRHLKGLEPHRVALAEAMGGYAWENRIAAYDRELEALVEAT